MKIGLLAVGFPNFRFDYAQKNLEISITMLKSRGVNLISCEKVLIEESMIFDEIERLKNEQVDIMIIQCGTYSFGSVIYKIMDEMKDKPLILWGFTEPRIEGFRGLPLNSLCAVNMYSSFLKRLEKSFKYFYGAIDDDQIYNGITDYLKAHQLKMKLRGGKFCVIGGRAPGFYLSSVDELLFKREIRDRNRTLLTSRTYI
jgi:L-fucose isomerase-like protein